MAVGTRTVSGGKACGSGRWEWGGSDQPCGLHLLVLWVSREPMTAMRSGRIAGKMDPTGLTADKALGEVPGGLVAPPGSKTAARRAGLDLSAWRYAARNSSMEVLPGLGRRAFTADLLQA